MKLSDIYVARLFLTTVSVFSISWLFVGTIILGPLGKIDISQSPEITMAYANAQLQTIAIMIASTVFLTGLLFKLGVFYREESKKVKTNTIDRKPKPLIKLKDIDFYSLDKDYAFKINKDADFDFDIRNRHDSGITLYSFIKQIRNNKEKSIEGAKIHPKKAYILSNRTQKFSVKIPKTIQEETNEYIIKIEYFIYHGKKLKAESEPISITWK